MRERRPLQATDKPGEDRTGSYAGWPFAVLASEDGSREAAFDQEVGVWGLYRRVEVPDSGVWWDFVGTCRTRVAAEHFAETGGS